MAPFDRIPVLHVSQNQILAAHVRRNPTMSTCPESQFWPHARAHVLKLGFSTDDSFPVSLNLVTTCLQVQTRRKTQPCRGALRIPSSSQPSQEPPLFRGCGPTPPGAQGLTYWDGNPRHSLHGEERELNIWRYPPQRHRHARDLEEGRSQTGRMQTRPQAEASPYARRIHS